MYKLFFITLLFIENVLCAETHNFVTCGSVVKLASYKDDRRLHSHSVKYGSGSGQQSVTATNEKEDVNSYWLVKGSSKKSCNRGDAIKCNDVIRLEHLNTKKNLHSHLFESPLSNNQEVSAFGKDGEGDSGDDWIVSCNTQNWTRNKFIYLKHVDTKVFLSQSGNLYDRPIQGQAEVVGLTYSDSLSMWKTAEGVFIKSNEEKDMTSHDEL